MLGYPWRWFFLNHHGHFLGCWKSKVRVKTDPRGVVKTVQVSLGLETPVGFDVIDVYEWFTDVLLSVCISREGPKMNNFMIVYQTLSMFGQVQRHSVSCRWTDQAYTYHSEEAPNSGRLEKRGIFQFRCKAPMLTRKTQCLTPLYQLKSHLLFIKPSIHPVQISSIEPEQRPQYEIWTTARAAFLFSSCTHINNIDNPFKSTFRGRKAPWWVAFWAPKLRMCLPSNHWVCLGFRKFARFSACSRFPPVSISELNCPLFHGCNSHSNCKLCKWQYEDVTLLFRWLQT